MKYSKEITQFLGVEENTIKSSLSPKTLEQMELAWARDRMDILHNLAYPLFKTQRLAKTIDFDFGLKEYKARIMRDLKDISQEGLFRIEPLTKEEIKRLQRWIGFKRRSAERFALKGNDKAKEDLPILISILNKLDVF